jgi:DNA polymerase-3 subunit delta'
VPGPPDPAPGASAPAIQGAAAPAAPAPAGDPGADVFATLTGQPEVAAELRRAAASAAAVLAGRDGHAGMAHAWLLTGPPGSGRSVAARAFAAALLCPDQGCGHCPSCRQVRAGSHADLMLVQPEGLSYGVRQTRDLVLRAATAPTGGRWHVVLFEDADRATEAAANALLKAIEEPAPRTVWLLCAPSAEDLVPTIRSRCRLITLRTPSAAAVAEVLSRRDGVPPDQALTAALAAQGHIGRARRLATDPQAATRREEVLRIPSAVTSLGAALNAAAALVKTAEEEARAVTEERDEPERDALRQAFGEGSTGKGVAKAMRGAAGALKDLEDRQKSRATRTKRDTLEVALLDLAWFYRDLLAVQFGAHVELGNAGRADELRRLAAASTPESTVRRIEAIMACRERLALNVAPLLAVEEMTLALLSG